MQVSNETNKPKQKDKRQYKNSIQILNIQFIHGRNVDTHTGKALSIFLIIEISLFAFHTHTHIDDVHFFHHHFTRRYLFIYLVGVLEYRCVIIFLDAFSLFVSSNMMIRASSSTYIIHIE